jgi:hypothetical protein
VDIKPRKHRITGDYFDDETSSPDFNKFINEITSPRPSFGNTSNPDFFDDLYLFVKNYNDKYNNLKMKKEHQFDEGNRTTSPMLVSLNVKNGIGVVGYCPLLEGMTNFKFERHMFGGFRIKKVDMLDFLNKWSKKVKFQNKSEVVGSPIKVPWTKKDYENYIEILKKQIKELQRN